MVKDTVTNKEATIVLTKELSFFCQAMAISA
jgi:hypothetical protein